MARLQFPAYTASFKSFPTCHCLANSYSAFKAQNGHPLPWGSSLWSWVRSRASLSSHSTVGTSYQVTLKLSVNICMFSLSYLSSYPRQHHRDWHIIGIRLVFTDQNAKWNSSRPSVSCPTTVYRSVHKWVILTMDPRCWIQLHAFHKITIKQFTSKNACLD